MSYPIISYRIISYHIIISYNIYRIISYYIISYIISYHFISYRIISYRIISYIISYHTMYHIISYIISYHIISYPIISYHIVSYHIVSYHISYNIVSYITSYHTQLQIPDHRVSLSQAWIPDNAARYVYFWLAAVPKLNGTPPPWVDCTCCNKHGAERSWLGCRSRCGSGVAGGCARSLSGPLRTTISLSTAYQLNSFNSYVAQLVITFLLSFQYPTTVL